MSARASRDALMSDFAAMATITDTASSTKAMASIRAPTHLRHTSSFSYRIIIFSSHGYVIALLWCQVLPNKKTVN